MSNEDVLHGMVWYILLSGPYKSGPHFPLNGLFTFVTTTTCRSGMELSASSCHCLSTPLRA